MATRLRACRVLLLACFCGAGAGLRGVPGTSFPLRAPGRLPRLGAAWRELARSASADWVGPVVDDDLEKRRQSLLRGLNASREPAVQEGGTIIWRGMRFSAEWTPIDFFDKIDIEADDVEEGFLPGAEELAEPTVEGWVAHEARLEAIEAAGAARRRARRALALLPCALAAGKVAATPPLRTLALSRARALALALPRWHGPASLATYTLAGSAFGALFAARARTWLREEREALPLVLLDVAFVRAFGAAVELAVGALAASAGASSAFCAGAAPQLGAGEPVFRALALGVAALREALTLSALWWWTDLVASIRVQALFYGKIGRAFRAWHSAATAVSALGLLRLGCELLAPRSAALAAALRSAPPPVGLAGAGSSAALAAWRAPILAPLRAAIERRLALPAVAQLVALLPVPWPVFLACSAAALYLAYALMADILSTNYCLPRRIFRPTLDRHTYAAYTPGAQLLAALGLRKSRVHYRETRAARRAAAGSFTPGSDSPEFMRGNEDVVGSRVWPKPTWPEEEEGEGEGEGEEEDDEYERAVGRPMLSASERRRKRQAARLPEPMMPMLQALYDEEQKERQRVRELRAQAESGPGKASEAAAKQLERLRKRHDRAEWGHKGPDAALLDMQTLVEAWARRLRREGPPGAYDLERFIGVAGTDDLKEAIPPAGAQLEPSAEAPAALPLHDAGSSVELRTLSGAERAALPFRPPGSGPRAAAQEPEVDEAEAERLALAAAADAREWEPEEPDTLRELERRARIFLDPSD